MKKRIVFVLLCVGIICAFIATATAPASAQVFKWKGSGEGEGYADTSSYMEQTRWSGISKGCGQHCAPFTTMNGMGMSSGSSADAGLRLSGKFESQKVDDIKMTGRSTGETGGSQEQVSPNGYQTQYFRSSVDIKGIVTSPPSGHH